MSKRVVALLLGVLVLALVAGCGGSDEETDTDAAETVTLTKAEFIEQADAICEAANEQGQSEAEDFAKENDFVLEDATDEELEQAVDEVLVPNLRQQASEIEALGAPSEDEDEVEEIVVSLEGAADDVEDSPGVAFEGEPLKEASQLAADYGFEVCGEE